MKINNLMADESAMLELGRRLAEVRLGRGMTQAQLAGAAGVAKRTVERLESGGGAQVVTLIRCLRALDRLDGLERLMPETPPNPIGVLERHGRARRRARTAGKASATPKWTWGEET